MVTPRKKGRHILKKEKEKNVILRGRKIREDRSEVTGSRRVGVREKGRVRAD